MERHRVSYDDLVPYQSSQSAPPVHHGEHDRPAKRGKWSSANGRGNRPRYTPQPRPRGHWDDPADASATMSYSSAETSQSTNHFATSSGAVRPGQEKAPVARAPPPRTTKHKAVVTPSEKLNLMDQSLWDDSELTNAWDAANEEYEVSLSKTLRPFLYIY